MTTHTQCNQDGLSLPLPFFAPPPFISSHLSSAVSCHQTIPAVSTPYTIVKARLSFNGISVGSGARCTVMVSPAENAASMSVLSAPAVSSLRQKYLREEAGEAREEEKKWFIRGRNKRTCHGAVRWERRSTIPHEPFKTTLQLLRRTFSHSSTTSGEYSPRRP